MTEQLFDDDNFASREWRAKLTGPHKQRIEALCKTGWYDAQRNQMPFKPLHIRPDLTMEVILSFYADSLSARGEEFARVDSLLASGREFALIDSLLAEDQEFVNRHLLRLELCRKAHEKNKHLSHLVETHFGKENSHSHRPYCPHGDHRYIGLYRERPLEFESAPTQQIFNSVGQRALFHLPSYDLKKKLLEHNDMPTSGDLSKFSPYDFLANQFLVGRIWAVRTLEVFLDEEHPNLEEAVRMFETSLREVRHRLKHPRPCYRPEIGYVGLQVREQNLDIPHLSGGFLLKLYARPARSAA